ncbi:N(G),N(G)-dimethylarginine dimethylaminohydrolase [candidate division GN15 bacterium]|uniref:N(G),N(G)-dimethylarginine dimethylaminohydrolase n=1 Tax=candidate division GN15 bacterium TaxID=2072418 RepID=A0A855X4S1_9BACT|nr:MAG: N(G),N(G)-dimethylarginine dimethylaminohydrolase [candidate division GN15 bacterium]
MRFLRAIVREPGPSLVHGITSANLGVPDYDLALRQHRAYVEALTGCGVRVTAMPADNEHPDATFVEDTALLTPRGAIIMRPGAPTRRGETAEVEKVVREHFTAVERVEAPGTADAGDIMMVGDHYYIGLSGRTNLSGADQIISILESHGLSGSTVPLDHMLHLKSGVSYLENHTMAVAGEFRRRREFSSFQLIPVDDDEMYAANSLWINGRVLVAAGFPKTEKAISNAGYDVVALDVSEFRKLDGGLSCLSLRF